MKPKIILLLCLAMPLLCMAQNQLNRAYSYDAAGNRIFRKTISLIPNEPPPQAPAAPPASDLPISDSLSSDFPISDFPISDLKISDLKISDVLISDLLISDLLISDVLISDVLISDLLISDVLISDLLISDVLISDLLISDLTIFEPLVPEYFIENIAQVEIKIYPNPATEKITLGISGWDKLQTGIFKLYTLSGQLLQEQPVHSSTTTISLVGFSKGAYILKVHINGITEDWKIIKQ